MDGVKMARIRRCKACEHCFWRPPQYRGTHGYARFCAVRGHERGGRIELHDAYMEGPEANCPAGYWTGLEPVDMEAEAEASRQMRIRVQTAQYGPILEISLMATPAEKRAEIIEDLADVLHLEPETRDALLEALAG